MIHIEVIKIFTSPVSGVSSSAQSVTPKYTFTMNILRFETNTIKSIGSSCILCSVLQLKQPPQPWVFQPVFLYPFLGIIVNQINILYTPLNLLTTIKFRKILRIYPFFHFSLFIRLLLDSETVLIYNVDFKVEFNGCLSLK